MTRKKVSDLLWNYGISSIIFLKHWFKIEVEYDQKAYKYMKSKSRLYLQIQYHSTCTKTGEFKKWHGRKWYLSDHMTADEIIKTVFIAFKSAVEHEIMEAFKVDGKILFNPHTNFEELLKVSDKEVTRKPMKK